MVLARDHAGMLCWGIPYSLVGTAVLGVLPVEALHGLRGAGCTCREVGACPVDVEDLHYTQPEAGVAGPSAPSHSASAIL